MYIYIYSIVIVKR